MELRIITWAIIGYILYRFITRFVGPIFKITKMTSEQMRRMQQQMTDMDQKVNQQPKPGPRKSVEGDYVDYEEVK